MRSPRACGGSCPRRSSNLAAVDIPAVGSDGVRLAAHVLDCPDPHALAAFYRDLLGGTIRADDEPDDDWVTLELPGLPELCFQRAEDHRRPRWTDPGHPQQAHLDFVGPDLPAAHERVLALGAVVLDDNGGDAGRGFWVYAEPAGHPFCL